MPVKSKQFQQTFGDFSDLFGEAAKKNVTIHENAVPTLLGAVAYCAIASFPSYPAGMSRENAISTWRDVLEQKQGQVLVQADIREWIRKWFPDPVQGEQVHIDIQDWMEKLRG
jgi:hypothetical protein